MEFLIAVIIAVAILGVAIFVVGVFAFLFSDGSW